jgi:hypothetical protein
MKWTRKSKEENSTPAPKRKISERTGAVAGKTVRVLKSTPGSTKNKVVSSATAFKAGFREEMPAKQEETTEDRYKYCAEV